MLFFLLLLILIVPFSSCQPGDDILLPLKKVMHMSRARYVRLPTRYCGLRSASKEIREAKIASQRANEWFVGSSSSIRDARIVSFESDTKKWDLLFERVVMNAVTFSNNCASIRAERIAEGLPDEVGDEVHLKSAFDIDQHFDKIINNSSTRYTILEQNYFDFYESSFLSHTSIKLAFPLENLYLAAKFYSWKLIQFFQVNDILVEKYSWVAAAFFLQLSNLGELLNDIKLLNTIPISLSSDCVSFLKMYPDIFREAV